MEQGHIYIIFWKTKIKYKNNNNPEKNKKVYKNKKVFCKKFIKQK